MSTQTLSRRSFSKLIGVTAACAALRPDLDEASLSKPLTMLLFGMVNWMFTWMKPDGKLDYEAMAPIVTDLFLGGLQAVQAPQGDKLADQKETLT